MAAISDSMWTCLVLLEGLEALAAELLSQARLLEAAERPRVVVGERVVEPDRSRP